MPFIRYLSSVQDEADTSWFALSDEDRYRFIYDGVQVEVVARCQPINAPPGYDHIQHVRI
ncbi:hypothetical protein FJZ31_30035 [Candidatus Poribacteria bacterium]|nr:hypothetical protein [Candidatus Poribacteria bacterium]